MTIQQPSITQLPEPHAMPYAMVRITTTKPFIGQTFALLLAACSNPHCGCRVLTTTFCECDEHGAIVESARSFHAKIDCDSRQVTSGTDKHGQHLAAELIDGCTDAKWNEYCQVLRQIKQQVIEKADLSSFSHEFDVDAVEDGLIVYAHEVFPLITTPLLQLDGHSYAVLDGYCLRTSCDCQDAQLCFCLTNARADAELLNCYVSYNIKTGKWQAGDNNTGFSHDRFMRLLQDKVKLAEYLPLRRKRIREAYACNRGAASTPIRLAEPRVGRNDPCPCGSGKKYKKCCLA